MDKRDLYNKLCNATKNKLNELKITDDELAYLKQKILNDKLGLILNYTEVDENLNNNYFGLKEIKELDINPVDKNNHLIIEGDNYYGLKALNIAGGGLM